MTMQKSMQSITRFIVCLLTANLYGIYYNKTKFKELGLEEPKTFKEFQEIVKKIKIVGILRLQLQAMKDGH